MATIATVAAREDVRSDFGPGEALRLAWVIWLVFLTVPFLYFMAAAYYLLGTDGRPADRGLAENWFIFSMAYLAVAVPGAFFWRSHVFKAYWSGQTVSPRNYLHGMITVWAAIVLGGIIALTGCLVSNSLLPNLLPAMAAFMLFIPFWPSGRAMTRPVGADDDGETYEEPR